MRRQQQPWLEHEDLTLKELHEKGATHEEIANILERSVESVKQRRYRKGYITRMAKQVKLEYKEPTKGAKYTRYMKPSTEVSILWGLIKYTKA
jgi:orotate phosphoribosyltransferase-like protein